ncbi:MAG: zinc ribbon domain-containing protein [Clostridia bacterium]|nr:zinc ribbon domain-containing protein [Clostridia bacterium]
MKYCSNCGEPLDDDSLFCSVCGAKVEDAAPAVQAQPAPTVTAAKPKKKKSKLWILAIPAVLLLIAFGVCLAVNLSGAYVKLLPASRNKFAILTRQALNDALDRAFSDKGIDIPEEIKANLEATVQLELNEDAEADPDDDDDDDDDDGNFLLDLLGELVVKADIDVDKNGLGLRIDASAGGMKLIEAYLKAAKDGILFAAPDYLDYLYKVEPSAILAKLGKESMSDLLEEITGSGLEPLDEAKTRAEVMEIYEILMKLAEDEEGGFEIEEKKEIALAANGGSATADVYVFSPTEKALKAFFEELADHFMSEDSYLGGRIRSLSDEEDVFGEMKSSAGEWAKKLHDNHLTVKIALSGSEVPFIIVDADDFSFYTDHVYTSDTESRYIEVAPEGRKEPALIKMSLVHKTGSVNTVSGLITIKNDPSDPVLDDVDLGELDLDEMDFDFKELTISFDLDLNSRSAISTFEGSVTAKADGKEVLTITVKPEGSRMKHVIKFTSPDAESELKTITVTLFVKEGSGVVLPALPEEHVETEEELSDVLSELVQALLGPIIESFFGGFGF